GIVHAAQPLQLDAPPIERARIPAPDHARVVYFPGDQGGQPIQGGTGVVPERLVFLYGGVGQRRGRDRIGGIRGEVVNQSVGLQVLLGQWRYKRIVRKRDGALGGQSAADEAR